VELQLAEAVAREIGTDYLQTASVKHSQMHSAFEGVAILKERYDILWEEVKRLDAERMRSAAVKLAASALRFVVETCPPTETADNGRRSRGRKTLDPRREKEILAFERWQRSVPEAGRGDPSPGRSRRKPPHGRPGQATEGCRARPLESAASIPSKLPTFERQRGVPRRVGCQSKRNRRCRHRVLRFSRPRPCR